MNKIQEVILEPSVIYTGSKFKIKIRAIRGATYQELVDKAYKYQTLKDKNITYGDLKGENS